jgi:hypothetical protein
MPELTSPVESGGANINPQIFRLRWMPIVGLLFTLVCPISQKYFYPFRRLFHYGHIFHISTGEIFFRVLLLAPFVYPLVVRRKPQPPDVRAYAVAAGMYWPMLLSTIIVVANSGYAIIWTWVLPIVHAIVAVRATVAVSRFTKARWCWLGVLYGLVAWFISSRT